MVRERLALAQPKTFLKAAKQSFFGTFDLYWSSVGEVINTTATDGDRAARAQAPAA
jgi:hypothetical protein